MNTRHPNISMVVTRGLSGPNIKITWTNTTLNIFWTGLSTKFNLFMGIEGKSIEDVCWPIQTVNSSNGSKSLLFNSFSISKNGNMLFTKGKYFVIAVDTTNKILAKSSSFMYVGETYGVGNVSTNVNNTFTLNNVFKGPTVFNNLSMSSNPQKMNKLTQTPFALPIKMNGVQYYIQLYTTA